MNPDSGEATVSRTILSKLESDPAYYLAEYTSKFGNVLNADNAATLFAEYNEDPARYRVAVHPAAQWIRDELFRLALTTPGVQGKNRVVFTAGGNAAEKSTVIDFAATSEKAQIVFDSTFSNPDHARRLVNRALKAGKAISIMYVNRPLTDAFKGMIERAESQGRVVTIEQLIGSQRGAAETVRGLWAELKWPLRRITLRTGGISMNSSTLHSKPDELQRPLTQELGDAGENKANRGLARIEASLAVAGLNRLREQKKTAKAAQSPETR